MSDAFVPQRPRRERLGTRLTRAAMGAAALALLVAAVIFNSYYYVSRRAELAEAAVVQARITADGVSAALMFRDAVAATEVLSYLKASPDFVSAVVRANDGSVFATFRRTPGDVPLAASPPPRGLVTWADGQLHVRVPVLQDTRLLGHLDLTLGADSLLHQAWIFGLTSLAAAVVALGVAYLLAIGVRRAIDRTEAQLQELAYVDPVTGLANRRAAKEQLQASIARHSASGRTFGIVLLDLDDFSTINDSLGHAAGDEVLRTLAKRLGVALHGDTRSFRFGGDEF